MPDRETDDLELPRGIALAWGVAAMPQRGPKREMSVERIVEVAVELADADGLGAVSMAAVAAALGYTPMSLYRYVSAKDDLVLLMQEDAIGAPPDSTRQGTWREQLEALYREQVRLYLEHPWLFDIPVNGAPATPNNAAWMDAGLHALADTPLSHVDRIAVVLLVTGHARWAGAIQAGYGRAIQAGGSEDAMARLEDALFRRLITAEDFPDLHAAVAAGVFLDESDPFEFGLARALDGVAAHLAAATAGRREDQRPAQVSASDSDIAGDKRYREARRAVRSAERALRDARAEERRVAREARERLR